MPLSFEISSPRDLLAKVRRDLARLEQASASQDRQAISDVLFDFAVSVTSVKDWLKKHGCSTFTEQDVEIVVQGSPALSAFRDIANASKHRVITRYAPSTLKVTASATALTHAAFDGGFDPLLYNQVQKPFRVKIVRGDGARFEAVQLAKQALGEWERFFQQHGL
jgi:hypothetical protein